MHNSLGNAVLSWDDFHEERTAKIKHMLANQTFTDVTLLCNDTGGQDQVAITAHRVILSAASEFFSRVLQRDQDRGAVLYLRGASKENVIGMLNFIYSGECSIAINQLDEFVALGKDLKIKSLENYAKPNEVVIPRHQPHVRTVHTVSVPRQTVQNAQKTYRRLISKGQLNLSGMKQPTPIAPAPAPVATEYAFVDPKTNEVNYTRGQSPVPASPSPDQLTQECEDIVERLSSDNVMDDDQNRPESSEILDANNMKNKDMTSPKVPEPENPSERETKHETKKQLSHKDPIALFEQKIESLITQNVENKTYSCKVCHQEASRRAGIVEHVETHIEGFMFACNSCSETFPNRPRLRRHKPKCPGLA